MPTRDQRLIEALAQRFWRWHDRSGAPSEVRSYLRQLAEDITPTLLGAVDSTTSVEEFITRIEESVE